MTRISDEIGLQFGLIQVEKAEEELRGRYERAKAIVSEIPSGTREEDLTPAQLAALDEYEHTISQLRELHDIAEAARL